MTEDRQRLASALVALRELRSQLDELKRARPEPVAVVGLGCRYPGAPDPGALWRLMHGAQDAIREVPPDRWSVDEYWSDAPDTAGKIATRCGGFLDGIDRFDPHFFGIAPREAASLDPQQRLLLEVAWEAMENAGLSPDHLRGSRSGVFVGISSSEYAHLLLAGGPERIDSYMGSGSAHSVAAGRLAYVFGFEGPALAVDTACSSSLVAVHLACQSLRAGECDLALAGGVNVLLSPMVSVAHSRSRMLAPDGRCKTFDAAADGFVRSEGCGLVVLKRLSRAEADGDTVLALIRGSAVNQDGRTSGLTVPSGPSQQAVIRQALDAAGLRPADLSFVEAHGTGTALGDPIELQALAAVFGPGRPAGHPLIVGALKTNIGHAEAAAGVAGLIKTVLAFQHGEIPPNLHFRQPNPRVAWGEMRVMIPTAPVPWPRGPAARAAGVSSFGFSGTNAHVVLSEPPPRDVRPPSVDRPLHVLTLSAQSEPALRALASRYAVLLAEQPSPLSDLCHTANAGRAHMRHRLCATAASAPELRAKLGRFAAAPQESGLAVGQAPGRAPGVAFLFTGQGSQYAGMGRGLFEAHPGFRRDMERCAELFQPYLDRSLLETVYGAGSAALDETGYTQPALFALEYCLGRLWMSWGVVPDLLLGHSLGEYAAACLAGVFSLEDAVSLVAARSRLMQALPAGGAMAAVSTGESDVSAAIAELAPEVSLAAVNGPQHAVVSGPRSGVEAVCRHFAGRGIETQKLNVSHAFHSALIEPALAEFGRALKRAAFSPPRLDLVSNLTGKLAGPEVALPGYWLRHARDPVLFHAGMRTLEQQGAVAFLEVGPQPVLIGMGKNCAAHQDATWLPSLRRGRDDWQIALDSLAALYARGTPVDWRGFDAPYGRRRIAAPTYPFQRERHWVVPAAQPPRATEPRPGADQVQAPEFYELRWLPQPRPGPAGAFLPEPASVAAPLRPLLEAGRSDRQLLAYADALAGLDALAPGYVVDALEELGWPYPRGAQFSTAEAQRALGIVPGQERVLERLFAMLGRQGALRRLGPGWEVLAELPRGDDAARTDGRLAEAAPAELGMLDRCGRRLAEVLTGRCDPLHLLFPEGDRADAAAIYANSPGAAAMHGLLREAVRGLRCWPAGRSLRVLEVGAGTGAAASYVLPELPPGSEYTYTDVSRGFFAEARIRFADYPFVSYEVLDIERSPGGQGFAGREFDLLLAFNVLHATRDLGESVAHVQSLLAPGGLLLLLENTEAADWVDLVWGLTPGWWRFADHALRPSHPLLTAEAWRGFLTANGFASAEIVGVDPRQHEVLGRQALVIAQKAGVAPAVRRSPWIVLMDAGGVGEALARLIEARGQRAVRVKRGTRFLRRGDHDYELDPLDAASFGLLLEQVGAGPDGAPRAVVSLRALDAAEAVEPDAAALLLDAVAVSASALRLVQALAATERPPVAWFVTRCAQPVDGTAPCSLGQAAFWGLGKTVAREHPALWGGMIDLDPVPSPADAVAILDEIEAGAGEDHVALRGGRRFVARVAPAAGQAPPPAYPVRTDGVYLITGGCGALGLEIARWLVGQGARHLVLLGRGRAGTAAARLAVTQLEQRGATVQVVRADVADEAAMHRALHEVRACGLKLRGVIHAAGLPGRRSIAVLGPADLRDLFAAKLAGAWALHRLTRDDPLDMFVLCSSMVSLWGAREQGHYAAANHALDALAHYRRALGLPALCVNWGPLFGGGMLPAEDVPELRRIGVSATPMTAAGDTLAALLRAGVAQAAAVRIDWTRLRDAYLSRGPCRLFDLVATEEAERPAPAASVLERLRAAPEAEWREIVTAHLQDTVGEVLGLGFGHVPEAGQGFFDMGLDSLTSMELRTKLQASLSLRLPATLAFDYGTIDALADHILSELTHGHETPVAPAREVLAAEQIAEMSDEEVAKLLEAKLVAL